MATSTPESVRRAVIAGTWYPGTERDLRHTVEGFLGGADALPLAGELMGLISPHAGYAYSGQTAAHAYRQLQGLAFDTVVIMAPSHRMRIDDYAANLEDAYETPLGRVPLDRAFIDDLAGRLPLQAIRADAEHSLEIQLPFLQVQLGSFALVPILVGAEAPAAAQRLGDALAEAIRLRSATGARCLLLASSDLHHIENYDEVVRRDRAVVDAVAAFDLEALTRLLMDRRCTVCGRMPILAALHACRSLGADTVRVLHHTNSGDVTGERRAGHYTVGYMAAAILSAGVSS